MREARGWRVVWGHTESQDGRGHAEVYVVLRGCATFTLDGAQVDAPAGTFVAVDPAVHRRAVAAESGTAVLALGGPETFEPAADEWIERARRTPMPPKARCTTGSPSACKRARS